MEAEKEIYTIDGKDYTVITGTNKNVLVRYAIEKIDEYLK